MIRKLLTYPFLVTIIAWNLIFAVMGLVIPEWIDLFALKYPAGGVSPVADVILDIFRLFSYTFVHSGILHLIANMLWLIIFCIPLHPILTPRRTMILYFGSGLIAGLFFLLSARLWHTPLPVALYGASGAVLGMCTGAIVLNHNFRFNAGILSKIPIYWYSVVAVVLTFLASPDPFSLIAHLGGVSAGIPLALILKPQPDNNLSHKGNSGSSAVTDKN